MQDLGVAERQAAHKNIEAGGLGRLASDAHASKRYGLSLLDMACCSGDSHLQVVQFNR